MSGPGQGLTRRFSDLYMVQEREAQERKRTQQALEWISRVVDVQGLPKDAWAALGDGVQLCRLVTALYPEKQLIKKYNPPNSRRLLLLENITNFLNACKSKDVGISAAELFEANDLLDGKAACIPRVVNVVRRLAVLAQERGFAEKWDDSVGQEPTKNAAAIGPTEAKAEAKAKAESDLEQTRAKAAAKFNKDGATSPRGSANSEKSTPAEDPKKAEEKLVTKLQQDAKSDADQNSAIHLAVKNRVLLPMLDTLNPSKEDLNKTNKNKQTPLHIACQQADFDSVEVLVKAGAAVNVADDQDKTPLHYAAEGGNSAIVTYLVEHGAEVDKQDKKKNTPLHLAARKGQTYSTMRLVQAGAKLNIMNESNEAPIQLATDGDHRGIIEVLVDNGAQLNVNRGGDGWSPLYTAAYQGVLETVELFIQNKAPLDSQNSEGWTSLHAAAEQGHLDVVTCLVKNKVKINIQNNQGVTPLYCAVNANRAEIVTYLLKHGADTNAGKKGGWKPLHAAARKASVDIVKQLIEFGADVDESNDEVKGYTPAMVAIARGKSGAAILETILAEGGAIDKTASNGSTCLHLAAYWGYLDLVKVLVDKGAKLDIKNARGLTALDQAAKFGYADVCEFLSKKMGVAMPKLSKASKQAKKADALIPDLAPTPEAVAKKEKESSKDKSSSKKK